MTTDVRCSCRKTRALVDYVRTKHPEELHLLWGPIQGKLATGQEPEHFLRDPKNRVDIQAVRDIMEQTRKITSDDMAVYKAALQYSNGANLRSFLTRPFNVFSGPKQAIKKAMEDRHLLAGKKVEIVSLCDNHAIIRLHWSGDLPLSLDFCLFAKGRYQAIPGMFNLPPARLWERVCFFKGGPFCEYQLWWDRRLLGKNPGKRPARTGQQPWRSQGLQAPDARRNKGNGPCAWVKPMDLSNDDKGPSETLAKTAKTVLLVDDATILIDVGRQMLQALGYEVMVAGTGEEAVKVYEEHSNHIDLVILDMVIPGMGVGKVYDILKAVNPQVRVLLSSGYIFDAEVKEALSKGCNGFIQKPFSLEQLCHKIQRALGNNDSAIDGCD